MSSKFYVYASGRWREIELDTGYVSGWGRPNFVYLQGRRLVMEQRSRVLNALRLLAAGRPSAAKDGCMLRKYIPRAAPTPKRHIKSPVHHQQMKIRSVNDQICAQCNDARFNKVIKESHTVATQYVSTVDASNQVTESMISPPLQNKSNDILVSPKKTMPLRKNGKFIKTKSKNINESFVSNIAAEQVEKGEKETSAPIVPNKAYAPKTVKKKRKRLNNKREQLTTKETNKSSNEVKELVIDEEVVEILRRYLKKNNSGVDLNRFNNDDAYKENIFYKINPLVVVERCPRIKWMLNQQNIDTEEVSLKEFMTSIGLQTVEERLSRIKKYKTRASTSQLTNSHSPHRHTHNNKENESIQNVDQNMHKKIAKVDLKDYPRLNTIKSSKSLKSPPVKRARKLSPQRQREVMELSSSSSDDSFELYEPPKYVTGSVMSVLRTRSSMSKSTDTRAPPAARTPPAARAPAAARAPPAARTPPAARAPPAAREPSAVKKPSAAMESSTAKEPSGVKEPNVPSARAALSSRKSYNRAYSPMEDQAIISWLQQNDRARLVNGNRLWLDLQREHTARTGVARSWHSLRNRYLRYILPTLADLAPQPVAVLLRAAAATGEIKNFNRKKPANNSMLVLPRVRSAWAPHRAHIVSSLSHTPSASPSPTGSSTPKDQQHFTRLNDDSRESTKISKRYSERKRKFRDVETSSEEAPRVLRHRTSDVSRRSRNPDDSEARALRVAPKKRRLYNPQHVF